MHAPRTSLALAATTLLALHALPVGAAAGVRVLESPHDAAATMDKLQAEVEARGLTVFARIDHAAAAANAGPLGAHQAMRGIALAGGRVARLGATDVHTRNGLDHNSERSSGRLLSQAILAWHHQGWKPWLRTEPAPWRESRTAEIGFW
ncbi:hypothetical protein [Thiohalocapsa sp. ML1]|jgi:hypothetical protein|uniref:hypothetical protein n=1 Tax=Thiohalocapsa sp. ML1 TaxID=1431688 RepID=UPI0007320E23|nr:hypothetical protein [Thiohalocapsa sp. ML1]